MGGLGKLGKAISGNLSGFECRLNERQINHSSFSLSLTHHSHSVLFELVTSSKLVSS